MAGAVLLVLLPMIACDDTSGPAPALEVGPDTLAFSFVHRRDTAESRQISIENVGGGDLRWTAEAEPGWLLVEPATGTAPSTIAVRVDTAGLIVGSYTGVIRITGYNGGVDSVIAALNVEGAPPSGISFVRGDTVVLIDPDGGNARPLLIDSTTGAPRWSPDGERFAAIGRTAGSEGALYHMSADGSDARLLVDPGPGVWIRDAGWSPDGREIVYSQYDETGQISRVDLWIVTVATAEIREFRRLGSGPAWSPDGEWIAFNGSVGSQSGIVLRRVDGTEEALLVHNSDATGPSWSPDGTRIAYAVRQDLNDFDLHSVDVSTGETTGLLVSTTWVDLHAEWSPDGGRVLFSRSPNEPGIVTARLFTASPDGSNPTELSGTEGARSGRWRPWVAPVAGRR